MRVLRLLPFCLLAVTLSLAAGCRGKRAVFVSPYPAGPMLLTQGTLSEFDQLLRERTPEHGVFWASGRISIRQKGVDGTIWFDSTILYNEPESFRLRGSRFAAGTLFELVVCGENAAVHINQRRELYEGTLSELRQQGGVLGSLSLQDMTAAILVNADLRRRLAEGRQWEVSTTEYELYLTTMLEDGRRMTWRVRRSDGLVREAVLRGPRGLIELQIVYDSYVLSAEGEPLPKQFMLYVLDDALTVRYKADEYKPRSSVKPENVCYIPGKSTTYPLSRLGAGNAPIAPEAEEPK